MGLFGKSQEEQREEIKLIVGEVLGGYFADAAKAQVAEDFRTLVKKEVDMHVDYGGLVKHLVTEFREGVKAAVREGVVRPLEKALDDLRPRYVAQDEKFVPDGYTLLREYSMEGNASCLYPLNAASLLIQGENVTEKKQDALDNAVRKALNAGLMLGAEVVRGTLVSFSDLMDVRGNYRYACHMNFEAYVRSDAPVLDIVRNAPVAQPVERTAEATAPEAPTAVPTGTPTVGPTPGEEATTTPVQPATA